MSGWRTAAEPRTLVRSFSVCTSKTGTVVSVRRMALTPAERAGDVGVLPGGRAEAGRTAAVHEEAVELLRERLHPVDVGDQCERRLRLADREHPLRLEVAESRGTAPERTGDLGVDVERVRVARVLQRAVPLGVELLEPLARSLRAGHVDLHRDRAAFHADELRGHADPRVAPSDDLLPQRGELGVGVDAAADVQPLDDDGAAEVVGLLGPANDDAGPVVGAGAGSSVHLPSVVRSPVAPYAVAVPAATYSCST